MLRKSTHSDKKPWGVVLESTAIEEYININFFLVASTLFCESSLNSIDLFSIYTVKHLLVGQEKQI